MRKSFNWNHEAFKGIITTKLGDLFDNVITRRKIMHLLFFLNRFSRFFIPWSDIGWYGNLNKIYIAHSRKQYIFPIQSVLCSINQVWIQCCCGTSDVVKIYLLNLSWTAYFRYKQKTGIKGESMNERKKMVFHIIRTYQRNEIEVNVAIFKVNYT